MSPQQGAYALILACDGKVAEAWLSLGMFLYERSSIRGVEQEEEWLHFDSVSNQKGRRALVDEAFSTEPHHGLAATPQWRNLQTSEAYQSTRDLCKSERSQNKALLD